MMRQDENKLITKHDGSLQVFNREKLARSISNSGKPAPSSILEAVESLHNGRISTIDIFQTVYEGLKKIDLGHAARYKLKSAIAELGPTGYPFEKFIGKLFENYGYVIQVGVKVKGSCISHEVDVVGRKGLENWYVECKYHGAARGKCDVKIPLYVQSRFTDILKGLKSRSDVSEQTIGGIYTNTRFTSDARTYGKCVGLKLISWDYPADASLKHQVELAGLHPITCLSMLSYKHKQELLEQGVVLCKTLCENPYILDGLGIGVEEKAQILMEAKSTCQIYEN